MTFPDPNQVYPLQGYRKMVFLKNIINNPNIVIGDYTYYDDFEDPYNFEKNVLYHFDFTGDKLIIGKFCAIASGVKFVMNGGNHRTDGISTFPFPIFGNGWERAYEEVNPWLSKGDTIVGNDVWIGHGAVIMPGVKIGDGAIIGTMSVVTRDVEPYAIVGGNPAQLIKKRFSEDVIEKLLSIKWWDWAPEKITRHVHLLTKNDVNLLEGI